MKHSKVAIAALVSLMMIAVPFSFSVDSDALSEGTSGIMFVGKDISDADYEILEDSTSKEEVGSFLKIFNLNINNGDIEFTQVSYPLMSSAVGYKVVGDTVIYIGIAEVSSVFDMTYTFNYQSSLPLDGMTEEGLNSLIAYLGVDKFLPGDKIEVSGSFHSAYVYSYTKDYRDVNDMYCIQSKSMVDILSIDDCDLDFTYYSGGASTGKSFTLISEGSLRQTFDIDYIYDAELRTGGNNCFVDYTSIREDSNLRYNIVFDGADHVLTPTSMFYVPEDGNVIIEAESKSDVEYSEDNLVEADDLYASRLTDSKLEKKLKELGTVTYTYSSVENFMNDFIGNGDNDDDDDGGKSKLPWIIGGGVLGAAAIGGVAFFLIRRN